MTIEERLSICNRMYKYKDEVYTYDIFEKEMNDIVTIPNDIVYFYWRVFKDGTAMLKDDMNLEEPILHKGQMETNLRRHDFMQLCYVYEGTYKQYIVDQVYEFSKGDLVLMDQQSMHYELLKNSDCFVIYIGIDTILFKKIYLQALAHSSVKTFLNSNLNIDTILRQVHVFNLKSKEKDINEILSGVLDELDKKAVAWELITRGALIRLINIMLSSHKDIIMISKEDKESAIYNKVITFINEHYSTITIKDLMKEFHYNDAYYSRLLKKFTSYNFRQYVQKIRLNKAKELLRTTDLTIDDIIIAVGYKNRGYFYRAFKEIEKTTPQMYRKISTKKATKM